MGSCRPIGRLAFQLGIGFLVGAGLVEGRPSVSAAGAERLLVRLLSADDSTRGTARIGILRSGDRGLLPALVDSLFFASAATRADVVACLEGLSGERLGENYRYWVEYLGGHEDIRPHAGYREWKAALFARIDPSFRQFLDPSAPMKIRPEEIVWGGVKKDGIPALIDPKSVPPEEASFLKEEEPVFGVGVGGQFRAYPQRILDWHEMANDVLGGQPFVISYCTLCGSAIAYGTKLPDGTRLLFGSSGLLYRSNKLMYDQGTLSLWSNLAGEPVAGALTGRGIVLPMIPMTITSWREWKTRHPQTSVISLDTGMRRDYTPGAAYGKYFASPNLMFPVWKRDDRLEAKDWVYALRSGADARAFPLAILFAERIVNDSVGGVPVVIVADPESLAVRAYVRGSRSFAEGPSGRLADPATGTLWRIEEDSLVPESAAAVALPRFPGHRAYWFGWYAFFPETSLYESCASTSVAGR
jgi:hypothetical protein